jgi:hypothetical protein
MKLVYQSQENLTAESEIAETEIGYYGTKWLEFMKIHHPNLFRQLKKKQTLLAVAESVNKYAREYKQLLDRQYEQVNPRPYEFEGEDALRSWKFTRDFYTDSAVMREKVLIPHRTAW